MSTHTATRFPELTDPGDDTIRRTVKALVAGREMSNSDVARAVNMSPATFYRRLERGGFSAREVSALATLFGLRVEDLFSGLGGQFLSPLPRQYSDNDLALGLAA